MELRIRSTGAVMLEEQLRRWLQETGGPSYETLTPEVMEVIGVDPVFEGPQPTGGTVYQYPIRQGVEQKLDGKWYTKYILGPIFNNDEDENNYKNQKDAERATVVRKERNEKLAACDWTQLSDSKVDKVAWAKYRQGLRDITKQPGFPWEVTWELEP